MPESRIPHVTVRPFEVSLFVVESKEDAQAVARDLIFRSIWFELMPMPDDHWKFTVKAEDAKRLS